MGGPGASRRHFLAGSLSAAIAACGIGRDDAAVPKDLDERTLQFAEVVAQLELTPQEREQALGVLEKLMGYLQQRRSFQPGWDLQPACSFDPRPPGFQPPAARFEPATPAAAPLPSNDEDIAFAPLSQLAAWLRDGSLTSTRLTALYLERLERFGPGLHAVVTITRELALQQAHAADAELAAGRDRGPLHGIPWGAKDLFDTAGIATTWGAEPFRERIATRDAAVVRRLRDAGAVLIAKLALGGLAYGDVWFGGRTDNPWNRDEGSAGSSAGPAVSAVSGLVGFAVGSETLGSIVLPSMRCGASGLRPTFGRVPRTGALPVAWSLDKIGPLCRRVDDCARVLQVLNAHDPQDAGSVDMPLSYVADTPIAGRRVGYDPRWFEGESVQELDRQVLEQLGELGVELVEVALPELPYRALLLCLHAELGASLEVLTLDGRDAQLKCQDDTAWPSRARAGRFVSAPDFIQADRLRRHVMGVMSEIYANVDALVSPSFAADMLLITNYTGHPSLTVRTGFIESRARSLFGHVDRLTPKRRVPHGITLWGRLYDEGTLCNLGAALERKLAVIDERPVLGEG